MKKKVVLIGWFLMVMTVCYVIVRDTENAAGIIKAFGETASVWEVVFNF